jgi:hypothetical protein
LVLIWGLEQKKLESVFPQRAGRCLLVGKARLLERPWCLCPPSWAGLGWAPHSTNRPSCEACISQPLPPHQIICLSNYYSNGSCRTPTIHVGRFNGSHSHIHGCHSHLQVIGMARDLPGSNIFGGSSISKYLAFLPSSSTIDGSTCGLYY